MYGLKDFPSSTWTKPKKRQKILWHTGRPGGPSRTTAQKLRETPMSSCRPIWRGLPTLPRPPIQAGQSQGRSFLSNTWACPLKLRTRPPTSSATEKALCNHHQSPKFLSSKQTRPLPAWRPRCSETPSHHKTKGRTPHSRSESTLLCSRSRKKNPRNWLPLDLICAVNSSLNSIICISQDKIYLTVLLLIKYKKKFLSYFNLSLFIF